MNYNHFGIYQKWEDFLFSLKTKNEFEKELFIIKNRFLNKNGLKREEYPYEFYRYISALKFYGTLFCDDFGVEDYYSFKGMKFEIMEI